MDLICLEDYTDAFVTLKKGDNTKHVASLTEERKRSMLSDFPDKFKKEEFEVEFKEPTITTRTVKTTNKAAKA